jgi:hypothetical protein
MNLLEENEKLPGVDTIFFEKITRGGNSPFLLLKISFQVFCHKI